MLNLKSFVVGFFFVHSGPVAYTLKLEILNLPDSLNKKLVTHWRKRNDQNKAWDQQIFFLTRGKAPEKPLEKARITIVRHSHRMLDCDNLTASFKPIVDALVFSGILIDDTWKVTGAWIVDQKFRKQKDGPRLDVLIEELT